MTRTKEASIQTAGRMKRTVRAHPRRNLLLGGFVAIAGLALLGCAGWLYVRDHEITLLSDVFTRERKQETEEPSVIVICTETSLPSAAIDTINTWSQSGDLPEAVDVSVEPYTAERPASCDVVVSSHDEGDFDLVWRKYYVLAAAVKSPIDSVTNDELTELLGGGSIDAGGASITAVIDADFQEDLDNAFGLGIRLNISDDVVAVVSADPSLVGVIPFELLTPRIKEIDIAGSSLLRRTAIDSYPLLSEVWVSEGEFPVLFSKLQTALGPTNYDESAVSTVVVTGTTVVGARGLYQQATTSGDWLYAWRSVGDILREADIAHVSNEGSFVDGCTQGGWSMVFCGSTESFEGLTWAGVDAVGLTGNHILDFGEANFLHTLEMYEDAGMKYFGGGANSTEAHTAAVFDVGDMKVAFLGYNMIPPASYNATSMSPGSAGLDEHAIKADIARVRDDVDFIFVDMQWGNEYEHQPNSYQTSYGHIAIDAGADIVTGVHPHWVQTIEYYDGGVIFYGLGNFLFDQTWSQETREGIMVRHYFYDRAYIGYELIPTILSETYRPEPADGADAERIKGYACAGL